MVDRRLQTRHAGRKLGAAPRHFAEPEGDVRRLAVSVFDPDFAALDAQDTVGAITQLEDIAGEAFHGEILIDAANAQRLRFQ